MHDRETVAEALVLLNEEGLNSKDVAERLGVSDRTVRDWRAGKLPRHSQPGSAPLCPECRAPEHQFDHLTRQYVYLLGLYLGDGTISRGPRGVHRLRVFLDLKYPGIVAECIAAMCDVFPRNKIGRQYRLSNYIDSSEPSDIEVSVNSKSLPCLFPQHGPGKKHERRIWLAVWQQRLAEKWPEALIRGMIHSDGHRFINTGRGGWRHPRYAFSNVSTDLTSIFCTTCDCLDLHWTAAFPKDETKAVTIYISRKDDVARIDEFVGPKA
jgi:Homeodomain-like domain